MLSSPVLVQCENDGRRAQVQGSILSLNHGRPSADGRQIHLLNLDRRLTFERKERMQTVPTPHRTPLRRLSQGSLFRLSRSGAYPDAPHGLGFLEPALAELLDEMEALQANVSGLKDLSDALGTFNESFASWLYVMNMNALTTDWPQAPTDASFKLAARRAGEWTGMFG